jgi:hypothetical protein
VNGPGDRPLSLELPSGERIDSLALVVLMIGFLWHAA